MLLRFDASLLLFNIVSFLFCFISQSFQRNLNIYGFTRHSKGIHASGYKHPEFYREMEISRLDYICRQRQPIDHVPPATSPCLKKCKVDFELDRTRNSSADIISSSECVHREQTPRLRQIYFSKLQTKGKLVSKESSIRVFMQKPILFYNPDHTPDVTELDNIDTDIQLTFFEDYLDSMTDCASMTDSSESVLSPVFFDF